MNLPFTIEQFLGIFSRYNQAVFPMQIVFLLLALFVIFLVFKPNKYSSKIISGILAFLWLWVGIVYHIIFFSGINPIAKVFGIFFIIEGLLLFYQGVWKEKIQSGYAKDRYSTTGIIFIIYALIIYPALGYLFGHVYPASPTFGVPCPTVIFTFGMLLLTIKPIDKKLLIIPFLWSVLGVSAAMQLGIIEDFGLLVAGVLGTILIVRKNKKYL